MNNLRYTKTDVINANFYRLPQILIYSPKYKDLSGNAKILYSILISRNELSVKNNWVDDEGHVYFYFSVERIMQDLWESKPSAIKRKKELVKAGLIEEERQGRNKPNRLYLLKVEDCGSKDFLPQEVNNFNPSYKEFNYKELNTYIFPAERRFSISNEIIQTIDDYCWERFNRHVQWKKENFDFDILEEIYQYYGTSAIEEIMNERINKISKCSLEYIESIQIAYEGYTFD